VAVLKHAVVVLLVLQGFQQNGEVVLVRHIRIKMPLEDPVVALFGAVVVAVQVAAPAAMQVAQAVALVCGEPGAAVLAVLTQ
jgi:hypothetical protein